MARRRRLSRGAGADRGDDAALVELQLPLEDQVSVTWPDPPVRRRLGEIRVPTLVVVGSEDVPDIRAIADLLASSIPGARLEEIAGAGHLPSLERPDELNRLLLDFLQDGVG